MKIEFDTQKLLKLTPHDLDDLEACFDGLMLATQFRHEENVEACLKTIKELVEQPEGKLLTLEETLNRIGFPNVSEET